MALDPRSPGDWLASVGVCHLDLGTGHWVPPRQDAIFPEPGSLWSFAWEGDSWPVVADVTDALGGTSAERQPTRWLNHKGQGTPERTKDMLFGEIAKRFHGPEPVAFTDRARTDKAAGWEIDLHWSPQDDRDPGRPLLIAALALIGAHVAALWDGHWPTASLALGHLWESGHPETHSLDCWAMTWRRIQSPGVPTAGPLGAPKLVHIAPPTWRQHVARHLEVTADDVLGYAAVAALYRLDEATAKRFKTAAQAGRSFRVDAEHTIPPPAAKVGSPGLVWDRARVLALAGHKAPSDDPWQMRRLTAYAGGPS